MKPARRALPGALTLLAVLAPIALIAADEPEIVTKTRADLPAMKKKLEAWRGLKFKEEVKVAYQTDEEFRAHITKEMDKELPPDKAASTSRAYARLGLLPQGYDIRKELVELASGQALAHYDPDKKTFFVLKTDMPEAMIPSSMFHELHHALQDQNWDLKPLYEGPAKDDDEDRLNAAKFLVEGEATYMMALWDARAAGISDAQIDEALEMQAKMPRDQMDAMERMQSGGNKTFEKAIDQRSKMPLSVYRGLVDPYLKGAVFVARVKKAGGWKAVDELWKEPPRSTMQVLHPETWLIGDNRIDPTEIDLPDLSDKLGAGWKKTLQNTLGELNLECIFHDLGDGKTDKEKLKPARSWCGDRLHAYEADGKPGPAIVWMLTWTKPEYAERFAAAYGKVLEKKYEGKAEASKAPGKREAKVALKEGDAFHAVLVSGSDALVLEAVPGASFEAVAEAALAAKKTVSAKHPPKIEKD
jgi:hypothetical protein